MEANVKRLSLPVSAAMVLYLSLAPAHHLRAGGRGSRPIPCHVQAAGRDDGFLRRQKLRAALLSVRALRPLCPWSSRQGPDRRA